MCMIEWADGSWDVHRSDRRVARKPHRCYECSRTIEPGETYRNDTGLMEGRWDTYRTCAHCARCQDWLNGQCNGFLYGGVREDLEEHRHELCCDITLLRLIVGMRRRWRKRDGSLMAVPA